MQASTRIAIGLGAGLLLLGAGALLVDFDQLEQDFSTATRSLEGGQPYEAPPPGGVSAPQPVVASILAEILEQLVSGQLGQLSDPTTEDALATQLTLRGWGDEASRSIAARVILNEARTSAAGAASPSGRLSELQRRAIRVVAARLAERLVASNPEKEVGPPSTEGLAADVPQGFERVAWKRLGSFPYEEGRPLPETVMSLGSQSVALVGYMLPVDAVRGATQFVLVESLWGCCFGAVPQMNQLVDVQLAPGTTTNYEEGPVLVAGKLDVGEQREEGAVISLYRLTAASVRAL